MLSLLRRKFGLRKYLRQFKTLKVKRSTQKTQFKDPGTSTTDENTYPQSTPDPRGHQIRPNRLNRVRRQQKRLWVRQQEGVLERRRTLTGGSSLGSRQQSRRRTESKVGVVGGRSVAGRDVDEGDRSKKEEKKKGEAGEGRVDQEMELKTVNQEKHDTGEQEEYQTTGTAEEGGSEELESSTRDINPVPQSVEHTKIDDDENQRSDEYSVSIQDAIPLTQDTFAAQLLAPILDPLPVFDLLPTFDPVPARDPVPAQDPPPAQDPVHVQDLISAQTSAQQRGPDVRDKLQEEDRSGEDGISAIRKRGESDVYPCVVAENDRDDSVHGHKDDPEAVRNGKKCCELDDMEQQENDQGAWEDEVEDESFGATLTRQSNLKSIDRQVLDENPQTEEDAEAAWEDEAEDEGFGATLKRHSNHQDVDAREQTEGAWEDEVEDESSSTTFTIDSNDPAMICLAVEKALQALLVDPRPRILPTAFNARPDTTTLSPFDPTCALNLDQEYRCGLRQVHFRQWSAIIKAKTEGFWNQVKREEMSLTMKRNIRENIDRLVCEGQQVMSVPVNDGEVLSMQSLASLPESSNLLASTTEEYDGLLAQISSLHALTAEFEIAEMAWALFSPAAESEMESAIVQEDGVNETASANDSDATLQGPHNSWSSSPEEALTPNHYEEPSPTPVLARFPVRRRRPEQIADDSALLLPRRAIIHAPTPVSTVGAEGQEQVMQTRTVKDIEGYYANTMTETPSERMSETSTSMHRTA